MHMPGHSLIVTRIPQNATYDSNKHSLVQLLWVTTAASSLKRPLTLRNGMNTGKHLDCIVHSEEREDKKERKVKIQEVWNLSLHFFNATKHKKINKQTVFKEGKFYSLLPCCFDSFYESKYFLWRCKRGNLNLVANLQPSLGQNTFFLNQTFLSGSPKPIPPPESFAKGYMAVWPLEWPGRKTSTFISRGCHNKVPQIDCSDSRSVLSHNLEARRPRAKHQQGLFLDSQKPHFNIKFIFTGLCPHLCTNLCF